MRYDLAFAREGYHSALMTSFRFDPPLFEDVILVRLRSNGCRNIAVLADQGMVNLAFTESGLARLAGRRYHLAKRRVNGAFHSKIVLQLGQTGGRLMCQRRSKNRPRGGAKPGQWRSATRHGARAYHIAGACHGALARRANPVTDDQVAASVLRARL